MISEYGQQYERLWREHWWWQARRRFVAGKIGRLMGGREGAEILDIGCGNGLFFDELARYGAVRGIEPDAGLVNPQGPWAGQIEIAGFGAEYAGAGRRYDLVVMLDVLEHIEDDAGAMRRVAELLKPGGYAVLTVPALEWLWSMHDDANMHYRRYTRANVREVMGRAGLEIMEVRYFFGWTVVPMGLRRVVSPGVKAGTDTKSAGEYVVRIPPRAVNALMYGLSVVEQMLLGWCGVVVGSSVVGVGRNRA